MFEKFSNIIEGKFAGPLEKLSNQRHLRAIRDGIIATLPIIIVSSLLMVVALIMNLDRTSTRLNFQSHLNRVCRLLLEKTVSV